MRKPKIVNADVPRSMPVNGGCNPMRFTQIRNDNGRECRSACGEESARFDEFPARFRQRIEHDAVSAGQCPGEPDTAYDMTVAKLRAGIHNDADIMCSS